MLKVFLATVIGVSFVSVQGHVQHVKGVAATRLLASPGQPASPLAHVTLGSGTTRAIEKDRQLPPLHQGGTGGFALDLRGASPHQLAVEAAWDPPPSSPPLHLRI
jgi:hypothetical protein